MKCSCNYFDFRVQYKLIRMNSRYLSIFVKSLLDFRDLYNSCTKYHFWINKYFCKVIFFYLTYKYMYMYIQMLNFSRDQCYILRIYIMQVFKIMVWKSNSSVCTNLLPEATYMYSYFKYRVKAKRGHIGVGKTYQANLQIYKQTKD